MKKQRPFGQSIPVGQEVGNLHGVKAPTEMVPPKLHMSVTEMLEQKGMVASSEASATAPASSKVSSEPLKSDVGELREVPIDQVKGGKYQPRRSLSEDALNTLALSITANGGLNNPVVVRPAVDGGYEIIGGHRRYQATRDILKQDTLLVRVRNVSEREAAILACVDNRNEATSDYENGMYYRRLMDEGIFDSITALATHVGVDRSEVSRCLAYSNLPGPVLAILDQDVSLLGSTVAAGLASLAGEGFAEIVTDAVERVHRGEITQLQALSWARREAEKEKSGSDAAEETQNNMTQAGGSPRSSARKEEIAVAGRRIATTEVKSKGKRLVFDFEDAETAARFYEQFKASLAAVSGESSQNTGNNGEKA